jgi:hypothetical protein
VSAARVLDCCDTVVATIAAAWSPTAPSAVSRQYVPRTGFARDDRNVLVQGTQIYVFPADYSGQAMDRGEQLEVYTIGIVVVSRWTNTDGTDPSGIPQNSWVDGLVLLVQQKVYDLLQDMTAQWTSPNTGAVFFRDRDTPGTVDIVYDVRTLSQHKAFWSELTFTLNSLVPWGGS